MRRRVALTARRAAEFADQPDEFRRREGFAENLAGTVRAQLCRDLRRGARSHENHRHILTAGDFAKLAHDFRPADVGQFVVEEHQIRAFLARAFDETRAGIKEATVKPAAPEIHLIELGNDEVIFSNKDSFHGEMREGGLLSVRRIVPVF